MSELHSLKEAPVYFRATIDGDKNFTIRDNDRNFQKGDRIFVTMIPEHAENRPQTYQADVTTVCAFAQKEGYVVLGIRLTHVDYKEV